MIHLFVTDFVKNRSIQYIALLGVVFDSLISHSLNHIVVLLGLPYLTSIVLNILMPPQIKIKTRISEQYRPAAEKKTGYSN